MFVIHSCKITRTLLRTNWSFTLRLQCEHFFSFFMVCTKYEDFNCLLTWISLENKKKNSKIKKFLVVFDCVCTIFFWGGGGGGENPVKVGKEKIFFSSSISFRIPTEN